MTTPDDALRVSTTPDRTDTPRAAAPTDTAGSTDTAAPATTDPPEGDGTKRPPMSYLAPQGMSPWVGRAVFLGFVVLLFLVPAILGNDPTRVRQWAEYLSMRWSPSASTSPGATAACWSWVRACSSASAPTAWACT